MASYIALMNWTDQGIRSIKQSTQRLDAARALAEKSKCHLREFFMTVGQYDMVAVIEAPNDEVVAGFILTLGSAGNLRSTTLKAFPEESYRKIIDGLA